MDGIGNTMQKKAAELERLAEVLVTGEQLRYVGSKFSLNSQGVASYLIFGKVCGTFRVIWQL